MLFAENPKNMQPDEFFGIFVEFMETFKSAKAENEAARKKKDEDERRRKMEHEVCTNICEKGTAF